MKIIRFALLAATLMGPVSLAPVALQADDHTYRDADHNDDHTWNKDEDRAYREWVKENHRKYAEFSRLNAEDQRAYWKWRHEHEDHDRRPDDHR